MAIAREKLYTRVEKELRTRFTRFDGWVLEDRRKNSPDFTFTLELKNRLQKVICLVSQDPQLSPGILTRMQQYAKAMAGRDVTLFARIIALAEDVPVPADLQQRLEQEGIELLRISSAS